MKLISFITICCVSLQLLNRCHCKENITLICLIPYTGTASYAESLVSAVNMAFTDINTNRQVLSNYQLHVEFLDSKVSFDNNLISA